MTKFLTNSELLSMALTCDCQQYKDIKSFKKWGTEGFKVKKGSKAISLNALIEKEVKTEEGKKEKTGEKYVRAGKAKVFCRCQVEERKEK